MLLGPHDRRLLTLVEIRLRPLLLSSGRTYFVVTADPVYVFTGKGWFLFMYSMFRVVGLAMLAVPVHYGGWRDARN